MRNQTMRLKILLLAGAALSGCQRTPESAAANGTDANAAMEAALNALEMNATEASNEVYEASDATHEMSPATESAQPPDPPMTPPPPPSPPPRGR